MNKPRFSNSLFRSNRGFTLIEVMISMGILSIGILAVALMQTSVVRNNKTGNTYTQATALAQAQMETLKNGDISDDDDLLNPAALDDTDPDSEATTNDPGNPLDENGNTGGIYNRSWTIGNYLEDTDDDGVGDTVSPFARTVTVAVTFPFAGRGTRQVTLTSVTTGGGL